MKYNYLDNNLEWHNAVYVYQVIGKCLKCDKEKIYKEYFGYDYSEKFSIETAKTLNNFRDLEKQRYNKIQN
jgi:hypothetical protein